MKSYNTSRLAIIPLEGSHTAFIFELINTPAWKEFIGERNIHSLDDALTYVQRIMDDQDIEYWVVILNEIKVPIGIVTFIKREYLEHRDIGFAFLPGHSGQGYALEAANEVLNDLHMEHPIILATTLPGNVKSLKLLDKLGFEYIEELDSDSERLLLFRKELKES